MYPLLTSSQEYPYLNIESVQHRGTTTLSVRVKGIEETSSEKVDRPTILNELYDSTHTVSPARQQSPETLQ